MKQVAVHFNFQAQKLSVREICANGSLGRLIDTCDEIALQDCQFTVDVERLNNWRQGSKHVRQFAEIRGYVVPKAETPEEGACDVSFAPRERDDFFNPQTGDSVNQARYATISGRKIKAVL